MLLAALLYEQPVMFAQVPADSCITIAAAAAAMNILAGDSLRGRGNGSVDLLKAGEYIGKRFLQNKLWPLFGQPGLYIPFRPFGGPKNMVKDELIWNQQKISAAQFIYVAKDPGNYSAKQLTDFTIVQLDAALDKDVLMRYNTDTTDMLIWTSQLQPDGSSIVPANITVPQEGLKRNILLVYASSKPATLQLEGNKKYYEALEFNVVGMLPGKSKPDEVIVFSAHYDHEGALPGKTKDNIMNGANDNASGTTALLLLADYFAQRNNNERTILFCAFSGEELGLLGSLNFISYIDPEKIVAGVNLEMIGVPQYGAKKVFITGEKYSSLPQLLQTELELAGISVMKEPDEEKMLFQRSDNFPFAEKGIPAHTIMASDDEDDCYHQPCDEIKRIDIPNMTALIKAIAMATQKLVNGENTPTRVNKNELK
jgi:hypothetical protein